MSPTDRTDRDESGRVVQKLWSYCHVLRDDGLSYQDYLEPGAGGEIDDERGPAPGGPRAAGCMLGSARHEEQAHAGGARARTRRPRRRGAGGSWSARSHLRDEDAGPPHEVRRRAQGGRAGTLQCPLACTKPALRRPADLRAASRGACPTSSPVVAAGIHRARAARTFSRLGDAPVRGDPAPRCGACRRAVGSGRPRESRSLRSDVGTGDRHRGHERAGALRARARPPSHPGRPRRPAQPSGARPYGAASSRPKARRDRRRCKGPRRPDRSGRRRARDARGAQVRLHRATA